jgi:cell division protein FtsN
MICKETLRNEMAVIKTYTPRSVLKRKHVIKNSLSPIFISLLLILTTSFLQAQKEQQYDEISVFLEVPHIGGREIDAIIKDEQVYLPITDLFDFLKIRNVPSPGLDSITGFFINPQATYLISRINNSIAYLDKKFILEPGDLIGTETNLYLRSIFYGKVFGLDCFFDFRGLSVTINSKLELPLIREMRLEEMRLNLNRLKGEIIADTNIARAHPVFKFGMADWSVNAIEDINGKSNTRLNLALGSMIAGGEATGSLVYNNMNTFSEKQQYYLWRYVNNDFSPLRQIMAGKIAPHAISSIYNPVIGVQFTNTPTTYRRSFGSYTLSDKTEPGWIVELYVNNVLVDYKKADASGFFTFEVPLVYGNTIVNLKFYGPWGEERTREQNINIPFNFLPVKTMEYNVSAGIVEDSVKSRFSRVNINYGLTRSLTVGGGLEYLSSVISGPAMPFLNASLKITNNLLFTADYTYGVKAKGNITYRLPSSLQFDINYSLYDKNQKAISYNYREERKAVVSMPLHIGKFYSYQRLSVYQIVFPTFKYTTGEWLYSGQMFGTSFNLTTFALFTGQNKPNIYSNLSMGLRLPEGIVFMPQAQYGYSQNKFISLKFGFEKHFKEHAFLNLSYEQMFMSNLKMVELGCRYDFSFAQTGLTVRQSNKKTSLVQYARGSLINDRKTKYIGVNNRTNVGRGGITIIPFIDLNANGKKDPGELKAYGLNLHANGGRVEKSDRDTTIRIIGLEPYTSCFIELDANSFDNITWRLQNKTLSVMVDPNIMKPVEIPVTIMGEAEGTISSYKDGEVAGKGRIVVDFYTLNGRFSGKAISEDDGYFSYFGLAPGKYTVRIDTAQLRKSGLISEPESRPIIIRGGFDGDIVEGLDFILMKEKTDISAIISATADSVKNTDNNDNNEIAGNPAPEEKSVVRKDTTYMVIHQVTQELVTITEDSYALQLGAFKMKANAETFRKQLQNLLGKKAEIVIEGDFFKVRITGLKDSADINENIAILRQNGVVELWSISLKAKQQQWVITNKSDSLARIKETIIEKPVHTFSPTVSVQVGAFKEGSKAIELKKRLSAILNKQVDVVPENGFFKVRVSGFTSLADMEKTTKSLGLMGAGKIWTLPDKKQDEKVTLLQPNAELPAAETEKPAVEKVEIPAVLQPDTTQNIAVGKTEVPVALQTDSIKNIAEELPVIPAVTQPDTAQQVVNENIEPKTVKEKDSTQFVAEAKVETTVAEVKPIPPEPNISLQVGTIYKHSEALRVQRKIISKLKVPVEIVKQWDYYRVIITGFSKREDTYRYYPELVGLGYQKIYLIEKK